METKSIEDNILRDESCCVLLTTEINSYSVLMKNSNPLCNCVLWSLGCFLNSDTPQIYLMPPNTKQLHVPVCVCSISRL